MKRVFKITMALMIIFSLYMKFNYVYANNEKGGGGGIPTKWTEQSVDWWTTWTNKTNDEKIIDKANVITTVIRYIGIICAVIALMVIGIKEMTSGVEEKSMLKQALPVYLLGVFMVVAITTLPTIIYNIVKGIQFI